MKKENYLKILAIKKYIIIILIILLSSHLLEGQVLISLLLGDKLNSDKLKFGLDGGVNFSNITNIEPSKFHTGFHLGFYFDILLKENTNWWVHSGVIVKSTMGTNDITSYPLNEPGLDSLLWNGPVDRQLKYFNIPILIRYQFKKQVFIEIGPMIGLLRKANDLFYTDKNRKKDLTLTINIRDQYHRIDAGFEAGLGFHLLKGTGMNFGVRYYQGLRNLLKEKPDKPQLNSSIYLFASIPIGAGKKSNGKAGEHTKKKK